MAKGAKDPETQAEEGRRLDGRNLIEDWLRDSKKRNLRAEYVHDKKGLDNVDINNVNRLLGKQFHIINLSTDKIK